MIKWIQTYKLQIIGGIALAILPIIYFVFERVSLNPLNPHEHIIQNGLAYVFLVLFSYFNHTIFVPRWYLNKRYWRYILVVVGCILGVALLPYRIEQWFFFKPPRENTPLAWVNQIFVEEMMLEPPSGRSFQAYDGDRFDERLRPRKGRRPYAPSNSQSDEPGRPFPHRQPMSLFLPAKLAIFFLVGTVSTLMSISVQTVNRLRQVENDQLQAELRQLKAQIQPHFLFNTLNSIYALAIRNDERTADTIVKLSEFMRYIIRDAHRDKVPLATEINYIGNYIDLQKARLRDAVRVDYQMKGDINGWQIAPLLLFSFIENAFKYGVNPEEDSLIVIHLGIQEDELQLYVVNNKVQVSQLETSTGIGLKNTQERLRLLYPDAHELAIDDTSTHFHVTLTLTLS